jgi:hypothetical protein
MYDNTQELFGISSETSSTIGIRSAGTRIRQFRKISKNTTSTIKKVVCAYEFSAFLTGKFNS